MPDLRTYLADKPKGEFARRLSITPTYLWQIANGRRTPSLALALKIESETDGAVEIGTLLSSVEPEASCLSTTDCSAPADNQEGNQ